MSTRIILNCQETAGIYIHVPFCLKKCDYCDFYSIDDLSLKDAFLDTLIHEMRINSDSALQFDTLYLGGGTPSILAPGDIERIMDQTFRWFRYTDHPEITIEVNPGTIDRETFDLYSRYGINRVNIGVQSFKDENLKILGRIHTSRNATNCIHYAKEAGFENIGIDLMYGIPGQSVRLWLDDLDQAIGLNLQHVSCYMLSYEPGTIMDQKRRNRIIVPLSEDRLGRLFTETSQYLTQHAYIHYEISNFAISESYRSRHNQKYWKGLPYLGFGPSAHSFLNGRRYWNHRSVETYIHNIRHDRHAFAGSETLNPSQRIMETIYLGLRTAEGIDLNHFITTYGIDLTKQFAEIIKELKEDGLMGDIGKRIFLTSTGMRFHESIARMFL